MLRPQGYLTIVGDQQTVERDSVGCGHCQSVVFVKPNTASTVYLIPQQDGSWREEPGAFCRMCMRPVCLRCHHIGTCTPFEKQLEQLEGHARRG